MNLQIRQIYVDYARDLQSLDVIDVVKANEALIIDHFFGYQTFLEFLKDQCFSVRGEYFSTWRLVHESDSEVEISNVVEIYSSCPQECKLLLKNFFYIVIKHFFSADLANSFANECLDYSLSVENGFTTQVKTISIEESTSSLKADVDNKSVLLDHCGSNSLFENFPSKPVPSSKSLLNRDVPFQVWLLVVSLGSFYFIWISLLVFKDPSNTPEIPTYTQPAQ